MALEFDYISWGTASLCGVSFLLFLPLAYIAVKYIGGYDIADGIRKMIRSDEDTSITDEEKKVNKLIEHSPEVDYFLTKTTKSGEKYRAKTELSGWSGQEFVMFEGNQPIASAPFRNYVIRGEGVLQVLTKSPYVEIELEDDDLFNALRSEIGRLKVEKANLEARLEERIKSVTGQIIGEHELRKETSKARNAGFTPQYNDQSNYRSGSHTWRKPWERQQSSNPDTSTIED